MIITVGPRRNRLRHKEPGLDVGKLIGQPIEMQQRRHHPVPQ
ncbi:Uncharacterised protein [Mycobacterium tuberculosis]|nr:Uncharacterised protein [Mycobacterium tuberculosis]